MFSSIGIETEVLNRIPCAVAAADLLDYEHLKCDPATYTRVETALRQIAQDTRRKTLEATPPAAAGLRKIP